MIYWRLFDTCKENILKTGLKGISSFFASTQYYLLIFLLEALRNKDTSVKNDNSSIYISALIEQVHEIEEMWRANSTYF